MDDGNDDTPTTSTDHVSNADGDQRGSGMMKERSRDETAKDTGEFKAA